MSADLLAEFNSGYTAPEQNKPIPPSASNDLLTLNDTSNSHLPWGSSPAWQTSTPAPAENVWGGSKPIQPGSNQYPPPPAPPVQNDVWGSFPSLDAGKPSFPFSAQSKNANANTQTSNQTRGGTFRRPNLDIYSGISNFYSSSPNTLTGSRVASRNTQQERQSSSGGEVLFDAEDVDELEDEDDFGEFETVTTPELHVQAQPTQPLDDFFGPLAFHPGASEDLLATNITANALPYPQAPKSPSFQERNPFADLKIKSPKDEEPPNLREANATPVTAWPTFEPKNVKPAPYVDSPAPDTVDEWGDFADLPPPPKSSAGIETDAWGWDAADGVTEPTPPMKTKPPPTDIPPPTNIPPPSVILTLFQPLFNLPQSALFKATANQPFALKNRILSDPSTIEFLRSYLLVAVVAARIIVGRKLRWKRDTILSQSMKIGSAAGKGMKLTGVDKAEATREDREAADVVRVWKDQLGRLKSSVAVANTSLKDMSSHLFIPEINDTMYVKSQEGAMTAPKQCVVCGLKRQERIKNVDGKVEDSFGEWWIEHWGHRACRNFWQKHESQLKK